MVVGGNGLPGVLAVPVYDEVVVELVEYQGGRVQDDRLDRVEDDVVDGLESGGYKSAQRLGSTWLNIIGFLPSGTSGRTIRRRGRAEATIGRIVWIRHGDRNSDRTARVRVGRRDRRARRIAAWVGESGSWVASADWIASTIRLTAAIDVVYAHRRAAWRRVRGEVGRWRRERVGEGNGRHCGNNERE